MIFLKKKRVFLDYASTTPIDKRVAREMKKYRGLFYNPSALYSEALLAKEVLDSSRKKIASILNADKKGIVFTSGGTEANNIAILGVFEKTKTESFKPHFITTNIEHPSVLEVFKEVERRGGEVTYVSVEEDGRVLPEKISSFIKENTVLVSVMYANNEIGTIQPIREIAKIVKEKKEDKNFPYFHIDASQAGLYLSLNIINAGVDMLTLDGIKIHGPRGIGMLYVKQNVEISPVIFGGGQERGLRSGTENVSAIAGLATALEVAEEMKDREAERLTGLRDYAIGEIEKNFPKATLNGSRKNRLPNNINFCFEGLDAEFAVISLDVLGVSASYSSSCITLKENSSSYVVEALGRKDCGESSLRFTLGRESRKSDLDFLLSKLKEVVK